MRLRLIPSSLLVVVIGTAVMDVSGAQLAPSKETSGFVGTWLFDMTEPNELKGTTETVRVWEREGRTAASVQVGKFPANEVTGALRDGDLLVLTTTLRENGQPIWVVISLKRAGETMMLAQMMERSQTIKRGVGKKQPD